MLHGATIIKAPVPDLDVWFGYAQNGQEQLMDRGKKKRLRDKISERTASASVVRHMFTTMTAQNGLIPMKSRMVVAY